MTHRIREAMKDDSPDQLGGPNTSGIVETDETYILESFKGQCPFLEQDFDNLLALQKGIRSRAWNGVNLNPREETTVFHFHKAMREFLAKGD